MPVPSGKRCKVGDSIADEGGRFTGTAVAGPRVRSIMTAFHAAPVHHLLDFKRRFPHPEIAMILYTRNKCTTLS
jgi:hypothetical protein